VQQPSQADFLQCYSKLETPRSFVIHQGFQACAAWLLPSRVIFVVAIIGAAGISQLCSSQAKHSSFQNRVLTRHPSSVVIHQGFEAHTALLLLSRVILIVPIIGAARMSQLCSSQVEQ
jgi:hypothetical protein